MRLGELVAVSRSVAETSGRLDKVDRLASLLKRLTPEAIEIEIATSFLSGAPRQGRIGLGGAALHASRGIPPAADPILNLRDVDDAFGAIQSAAGPGSSELRAGRLGDLLRRATRDEQDFLLRLIAGDLRQGALEGVLVDAVARAAGVPPAHVRRAMMMAGALGPVARVALIEGDGGLSRFLLRPFQPVQPMLADSAADVGDALTTLGEASLEYKLDGARIQVHKVEDEVRVFSRSLRDVTIAVPEVVNIVRALPARELILDGEVIALTPGGAPHPFQITMRRFGRKLDVDRLRQELPVTPFFFDALFLDGDPLIDEPLARRAAVLADHVPAANRVPRVVTASPAEAEAFAKGAVDAGHEGVMAKAIDGTYAAGRRGSAWLKVKQAHTLDLVILAAEWGSGRRRGTLSNLHLGARDDQAGSSGPAGFVMLGKTFKGLTDAMLSWQTAELLAREIGRNDYTVFVRPEIVVEIAFNDVQASPQYPGGVALRFARVKRYRPDKTAAEADTITTVQAIYRSAAQR
jgi:ATP-dependent DNA ligase I